MTSKDNMEEIRSYFIEILLRLNDIEQEILNQRKEKDTDRNTDRNTDRLYGGERYTDHGWD